MYLNIWLDQLTRYWNILLISLQNIEPLKRHSQWILISQLISLQTIETFYWIGTHNVFLSDSNSLQAIETFYWKCTHNVF